MLTNRIGLYGGSFDPIHFGHLNLAVEMMERLSLAEVWFCPARINPHKEEHPVPTEHRLNMLRLAIQDVPQFSILESELLRPAPSYTVDTVEELLRNDSKNTNPHQFYLIIGDDSIKGFPQWHRAKELIQLVPLLVGKRNHTEEIINHLKDPEIREAIVKGLTPTKIFEISSTEVRERIHRGQYCGHLVPEKVLDYIHTNSLYYQLQ